MARRITRLRPRPANCLPTAGWFGHTTGAMKKTFQLKAANTADARVVEAVKGEVRKYIKRERRKPVPAGVDFWDFACRVGPAGTEPVAKHVAELAGAIDAAAQAGSATVFVEVLAKPGIRTRKPAAQPAGVVAGETPAPAGADET